MKQFKTRKFLCLQLFLCMAASHIANAQKLPDSLKDKSYEYLIDKLDHNDSDSIKTWTYLNSILAKAKKENNHKRISKAYEEMSYLSSNNLNLTYADSMIAFCKKIKNNDLIANAYLTKGSIYYSLKKYNKALDNYIIANEFAYNTKDEDLKYTAKYDIANIKFYLGFYSEAEVLFRECVNYYKTISIPGYINSLHALGTCYNKMGKYELCSHNNGIGLKTLNISRLDRAYFIHSEGVNQYSKKNYSNAIKMINESLSPIIYNHDFANEAVGYFYMGKSYLALGNKEAGLKYFKKVEKIFVEKNYTRPDIRENFEILIDHYKQEGNTKMQLHYVEQLIKADSILSENFKYISGKMHKEYDSRKLELAKNKLQEELDSSESTTYILYLAVLLLTGLVLFLLFRYYANQRTYRKKFDELMTVSAVAPMESTPEKQENKKPDINPEVIASILKQLEKFESQKKFLQKELTLVNLAAAFGTNSNYLSKVISYSRDKNYISYINDLRIDYIVNLLKNDSKFRNYTIKALADEAGFSTAQHFSKAFFAHTGIYPSYFITELNRSV